jgi:hypothetical protein
MNAIKDLYKLEMNGKTIVSWIQNEEKFGEYRTSQPKTNRSNGKKQV